MVFGNFYMPYDDHPNRKVFTMNLNFDTANLKRQIEEQPLIALGVVSAALTGAAKLMNANTARKNSKTWKREVDRRQKKSK